MMHASRWARMCGQTFHPRREYRILRRHPASDGAEVYLRTDLALAPVKAYVWKNVEGAKENEFGKVIIAREFASGTEMTVSPGETLVVDFGQNCAGVPSFVFKAAEGTVLTCLPAELLNDGNGPRFVAWTVRKELPSRKPAHPPHRHPSGLHLCWRR